MKETFKAWGNTIKRNILNKELRQKIALIFFAVYFFSFVKNVYFPSFFGDNTSEFLKSNLIYDEQQYLNLEDEVSKIVNNKDFKSNYIVEDKKYYDNNETLKFSLSSEYVTIMVDVKNYNTDNPIISINRDFENSYNKFIYGNLKEMFILFGLFARSYTIAFVIEIVLYIFYLVFINLTKSKQ